MENCFFCQVNQGDWPTKICNQLIFLIRDQMRVIFFLLFFRQTTILHIKTSKHSSHQIIKCRQLSCHSKERLLELMFCVLAQSQECK